MITETDYCPETGDRPDPPDHRLRVDLAGCLGNAARCIDRLAAELRGRADWHPDSDEDDPADNAEVDSFMLREIAKHAAGVASGLHDLHDFARHYCLTPTRKES